MGDQDLTSKLTREQASHHDRLYSAGWTLIEDELLLAGSVPRDEAIGFARKRLIEAKRCFEVALQIVPDNWPSFWALGKIHQRLGNPSEALACLSRAHDLAPSNADVAREAGIVASDLGHGPAAVRFCRAAIAADPADVGLMSNLAIALLVNGDVAAAQVAAAKALSAAPDDGITNAVQKVVDDVAQGRRSSPRTARELE